MTDTMLLLSCMKCKRITLGYAAEVLGISSSTLRYKINNDRDGQALPPAGAQPGPARPVLFPACQLRGGIFMTQQQRRATRNALARYGQRGYRQTFEGRGWSLAIEQALSYYDQTDPIRARLLRMRYFEHRSIEDVMEQLNLSYSTYQKAHSDLLSTIAVYAAHNGQL